MKRDANLWLVLGRGYLLQRRRLHLSGTKTSSDLERKNF